MAWKTHSQRLECIDRIASGHGGEMLFCPAALVWVLCRGRSLVFLHRFVPDVLLFNCQGLFYAGLDFEGLISLLQGDRCFF